MRVRFTFNDGWRDKEFHIIFQPSFHQSAKASQRLVAPKSWDRQGSFLDENRSMNEKGEVHQPVRGTHTPIVEPVDDFLSKKMDRFFFANRFTRRVT
jgi:hypothetical protein